MLLTSTCKITITINKKLMKKLLLLLLVCVSINTHAQQCQHFDQDIIRFYCNDSLHIESTSYNDNITIMTWLEDQTNDGIKFTLHANSYVMYIPELNTIYRVSTIETKYHVAQHFLYLLDLVRANKARQPYFLTQKKP